jgi:hypothetical protein
MVKIALDIRAVGYGISWITSLNFLRVLKNGSLSAAAPHVIYVF